MEVSQRKNAELNRLYEEILAIKIVLDSYVKYPSERMSNPRIAYCTKMCREKNHLVNKFAVERMDKLLDILLAKYRQVAKYEAEAKLVNGIQKTKKPSSAKETGQVESASKVEVEPGKMPKAVHFKPSPMSPIEEAKQPPEPPTYEQELNALKFSVYGPPEYGRKHSPDLQPSFPKGEYAHDIAWGYTGYGWNQDTQLLRRNLIRHNLM